MCGIIELVESSDIEVKRGRGRPRKEITEVIEETEPVIKKKGRPKKIVDDAEPKPKRPRGRARIQPQKPPKIGWASNVNDDSAKNAQLAHTTDCCCRCSQLP